MILITTTSTVLLSYFETNSSYLSGLSVCTCIFYLVISTQYAHIYRNKLSEAVALIFS